MNTTPITIPYIGRTGIIGQVIAANIPLLKAGKLPDPLDRRLLFTGPAGVAKTDLAHLLAGHIAGHKLNVDFRMGTEVNVEIVRDWVRNALYRPLFGDFTVRLLDEIDTTPTAAVTELRGYLIGNNATLERLIFAPGAPHSAVAKHIWAHLVIPGNPMTGLGNCQWQEDQQFHTGVLYFARDHTVGPKQYRWPQIPDRVYRQGAELRNEYCSNVDTAHELWQAVRERVHDADGLKPKVPWNLCLAGGTIRTALSLFEKHSRKINKREIERLHALEGQAPMELVLQRATRDELLRVSKEAGWRVEPALLTAIDRAVQEYHAQRAPLYPLPEIQRLGYLDEEDTILCKGDLADSKGRVIFQAGQSYPLRTQSVRITRQVVRPNSLTGEDEDLEYSGEELAFFLKRSEQEFCFMDAKLKDDAATEIPNCKQVKDNTDLGEPVDFTLEELCSHFAIPDVPDVAAINPTAYSDALGRLNSITSLLNAA